MLADSTNLQKVFEEIPFANRKACLCSESTSMLVRVCLTKCDSDDLQIGPVTEQYRMPDLLPGQNLDLETRKVALEELKERNRAEEAARGRDQEQTRIAAERPAPGREARAKRRELAIVR